jgi:cytochrome P450
MPILESPPLRHENPFRILVQDLADERAATVPYPPGDTGFSLTRTKRFIEEPLPLLLEGYERYGPIFTLRILHSKVVFMLGPAANHYITVSHANNFLWRESHFRDLIALLGDGLLTTDDPYHRRARSIMLPAFHRERVAASIDVMAQETEKALEQWGAGDRIDLYAWTRRLATRVAMRALFGIEPDGPTSRSIDAAAMFEQALAFYSSSYEYRFIRGLDCSRPPRLSTGCSTRRSPAGAPPASAARTCSACCSMRRTTAAKGSRTNRSATR